MTCYDETRDHNAALPTRTPYNGPRVHRDGLRVDEIAEDAPCFVGHVRPRRHVGRDSNDGSDDRE